MEKGDYQDNFPKSKKEWQPEVERQNNELIAWIDEFLESDEYADILRERVDLRSKDEVNSWKKSPNIETLFLRTKDHLKYDDTKRSYSAPGDNLSLLEGKVQGSLTRLKIKNTVENQRRGIEIIRNKILEARNQHDANTLIDAEKSFQNKAKALSILRKDFPLSLGVDDLTEKVMETILKVKHAQRNKSINVNKNKAQVVANIVRDMKREEMEKRLKKGPIYKINRRRKRQSSKYKDLMAETTEELSIYENYDNVSTTKSEDNNVIEAGIPENKIAIPKKGKKEKNLIEDSSSKTSKKQKKASKTKFSNKKDDKLSKKSSKREKVPEEVVLPSEIPNPNPRKKVLPEYVMTELLDNITKLYNYLKDKESYEIEDGLVQDIQLPTDEGFFSRPNKIIFKDYKPGKRYKKIISIVNGNCYPKKICLDRVIWNADVEEDLLLEVESFGVRRVLPGMSFKVYLRFAPEVLNKTADGKIVFVTTKLRSPHSQQFVLNVVCVPLCAAVLISPTIVSFEDMPIWRAQSLSKVGKNYKTIKITNSGLKECKVVVTKIFNNQTMEQEWKKIISIIRIDDNSDGERKHLSSSNLEDPSAADPFPRNLVQQCVENVFNVFKFERNVFNVQPKTTMVMKCWLKDLSEAGYQVETYNFSIYERFLDGQLYCIGAQDVIVNSETTSHFLTSNVEILDFEVCVYGSVYQLDFELTNPCKLAHHIRICFPSRMKSYLQSNPGVTTILSNQTIKICIKFLPTEGILSGNKFFDQEICLLEFPVYVTMQTKGYEDTPPLRIDVFAAVTESQGVVLEPLQKMYPTYENEAEFYDLGSCTTMESVYLDVVVNNISLVPQQFGFLSLPQYITISPNFGFGQLKPMQKATVRVMISPSRQDVISNSGYLKFQLALSTIKHCGANKKKSNDKDIVTKLKQMEDLVCKSRGSNSSKLKADILALKQAVKRKTLSISSPTMSLASVERFMQAVDNDEQLINLVKYDIEEEKEKSSNMEDVSTESQVTTPHTNLLNCRVSVVDVAVELSHQIINFPDTACGSYSYMSIDIVAHKVSGFKYQATFEIFGSNESGSINEFEVQPSFGKLVCNKKKSIWIIARPSVPKKVIEERALNLKRTENEKVVLENEENNKLDGKVKESQIKGKTKSAKSKASNATKKPKPLKNKGKDTNKEDESLVIGLDDYYQAEMNVWRTMEPYIIEGLFTCRITYIGINNSVARPPEEIQFKVSCRVVAPNFIHDQKYQVIDFGSVVIGSSLTRTINFQNIQRNNIIIDVSATNPIGPYSSTVLANSEIPPEYIYSYPIIFAPAEEQSEIEFLDIISDNTSYFFVLRGVGIKPNLIFNPNFTVCRISTVHAGFQDCTFDVKNESDIQLNLYLQKVCELEGTITKPEVIIDDKKMKSTTKPKQKREKFSFDLYDDEILALQTSFELRQSSVSTLFHVIDNTGIENTFHIEAHSKGNIKIRCGEIAKPVTKGNPGRNVQFEKNSKSKTGTIKSTTLDNEKYYIAKYNIFVGRNYVKDIIIVSNIT